ncbi:MAG: Nucleotide sugar dehydrogenase [Microgenomates group bacterium GW2011_GWF2_45_18]|nr:MAG: Nucleotide sugar dehydrogenase [Microgenomates group bacterium GW2011_GWF2_45_18]
MMNILVIGTGFVGVVSSAVFSSFGNTVIGLDVDEKKIQSLTQGNIPFFEPQLKELVQQGITSGNLTFSSSYAESVPQADVIILAVGTPSAPDGQADLKYVFASIQSLAPYIKDQVIIAIKSTVPPGTNQKVRELLEQELQKISKHVQFHLASLPEFLKEGSAVDDTLHPDRVVIGSESEFAKRVLSELHEPFRAPILHMKPESAQMCKYASNAYLATRITFVNQIANLCEENGANIQEVIQGMGYDKRIGSHYWYPGLGYGGSCFPKDVKELSAYAKAHGQSDNLLVTIDQLNEDRISMLLRKYEQILGGWQGKQVAVLGLAFKPNTDDLREAPSTKIIPQLLHAGATVRAYDPMATPVFKSWYPDLAVAYFELAPDALKDADCVFVLIEWKAIIQLSPEEIATQVKQGALFIDARNQFLDRRAQLESQGIRYMGIGV